ncbi:hypothetical protein S7335_2456 [Synechococcus sp. PCC 7335]|nr:hypothetical protein S7335_2456 [Synechococcus sp. PCC 7335]
MKHSSYRLLTRIIVVLLSYQPSTTDSTTGKSACRLLD